MGATMMAIRLPTQRTFVAWEKIGILVVMIEPRCVFMFRHVLRNEEAIFAESAREARLLAARLWPNA